MRQGVMYCNFESKFNIPVQVIIPEWVPCTSLLQHNSLAFLIQGFANPPNNLVYFTPTVVANVLSQVIFAFLLFLGMVIYANEVGTNEK